MTDINQYLTLYIWGNNIRYYVFEPHYEMLPLILHTMNFMYVQQLSVEFRRWMAFYGKEYSPYELERGDFLCEDMKEKINSAT